MGAECWVVGSAYLHRLVRREWLLLRVHTDYELPRVHLCDCEGVCASMACTVTLPTVNEAMNAFAPLDFCIFGDAS